MHLSRITFCIGLYMLGVLSLHAAVFSIEESVAHFPGNVAYDVYLDTQGENINALSGELSFSSDYLGINQVSTKNSIVNLWPTPPKEDTSFSISINKRIPFEGVIPGGFIGVQSPYYKGVRKGLIFHTEFIAKKTGITALSLSNLKLYKNDGLGTLVPVDTVVTQIELPTIPAHPVIAPSETGVVRTSPTLTAYIVKQDQAANGLWTLVFNEDTSLYPVDHYEVSESRAALASSIPSYSWSTVSNPYVLSHQTRNYYVHVKAVYNDGTIAYITLSPVENKETNSLSNAILSSIGVLAALSLFYVTYTSFIARRRK